MRCYVKMSIAGRGEAVSELTATVTGTYTSRGKSRDRDCPAASAAKANVAKAHAVATTRALTGMTPTRPKKARAAGPSSHT